MNGKELRRQIKQNLELKKVIKKNGEKSYVEWKVYENALNTIKTYR